MKNRKSLITIVIIFTILLTGWHFLRGKTYVNDSDFVMRENTISPNKKHRIIDYDIDVGALGFHGETAITPVDYQELNLAGYTIPNCYNALGWTDASELIIAMEGCNSYKQSELKTGDIFQNVKVQVVNADEFLLKQGIIRVKTIAPSSANK